MLPARTVVLTSLAMLAFAGNSVLCRVALAQTGIVVLVAAGVWFLYRVIKGMVYLQDGKTMYLNNSPFPPGYKRGS